ncbi:MAG: hypothetical protein A2W01_06735 [Candidatus Solincola sediminis]|nr:MAG: hypothetical protein A2W01_06735 [Candidatus Solincola sediminis]
MNEIVRVEQAVKKYHRGAEEVRAVDGVTLEIPQGDFLAVVGRSGSGKTTLLNLMGCVDRPSSGAVTVHGLETGQLSERALATIRSTTIGFVFQHFFLMPTLTAVENVMVPGRFCAKRNGDLRSRAMELLDMVDLGDRANHLPHELSGGEMQRVALARALINEPAILLADEPTGNLDTKSAGQIAAIFEELNRGGLTIVVVTHSAELTGNAARIIHLSDGKIVDEQRLRPLPVSERVQAGEPDEKAAVPEYMPSSRKKRRWGSPAVATLMVLLGAWISASAFLPFIGKFSGYQLVDRGLLSVRFYKENNLTRVYTGEAAVILTGLWPLVLGLLLVAAAVLFLLNFQRISRWSAIVIGSSCALISGINVYMIGNRLGPNVSVEYGVWILFAAGITTLVLGVLLVLAKGVRNKKEPG